jgi:NADPH2:quinone reductase
MTALSLVHTMRAVRMHATGGPEVLTVETIPVPQPDRGEALVRIEAAGVNFIDVYKRAGLYRLPLPATIGEEGAGTVVAVGEAVSEVRVGGRVAWATVLGAYAEFAVVPATKLVMLPDAVSARVGAAVMLQRVGAEFALADVANAHRALEGRRTTGKVLLQR